MSKPTMIDETEKSIRYFWSCPVRFIPSSVFEFIRYYTFYQNHPSSPFPSLEKISPRYLQAEEILQSELLQNGR